MTVDRNPHTGTSIPSVDDVVADTPNPASAELLGEMRSAGVETVWDRFEAQQPQCGWGLRGTCCRMCQWGPCRITEKAPRGICGRDLPQIVFSNLLRALVSGMAGHGAHAYEVVATMLAAADGRANVTLKGLDRALDLAGRFGIPTEDRMPEAVAADVARALADDLGRLLPGDFNLYEAFAPEERREIWRSLGVEPRSASYETMEALHMTTLGACSDWRTMAEQELRSALAYCYATLFASSMATEVLYGVPTPKTTEVNYGVLKPDHVNILLHGHSPVMVEKVIEKIATPEIQALAREVGAEGIVLGGMCCTGDELLARYGIPTVTNIMGQELALGTGSVDAVIVDMQCVIPGMKIVADCFGTLVITTNKSNRIPGALHVPFEPDAPETLDEDAHRVAVAAVEAFRDRDRSRIRIPQQLTRATSGWSYEATAEAFGGIEGLAEELRDGRIRGLATIVGCNTPKVVYEASHVTIARGLVEHGVLLTTTGCCSHALLNAGLTAPEAVELAPEGLRSACEDAGAPPVLAVGGCVDNVRSLRLMIDVAAHLGVPMAEMPYLFIGPEPGNEKAVGQGATFFMHGVTNLTGYPAQVPVRTEKPAVDAAGDGNEVVEFFGGSGLYDLLGARVVTKPVPADAVEFAIGHFEDRRARLGWS